MKLYLLKLVRMSGYDYAKGFVVRAESELDARGRCAADEGAEGLHYGGPYSSPWFDPVEVSCEVLIAKGERGVLLQDFRAG